MEMKEVLIDFATWWMEQGYYSCIIENEVDKYIIQKSINTKLGNQEVVNKICQHSFYRSQINRDFKICSKCGLSEKIL